MLIMSAIFFTLTLKILFKKLEFMLLMMKLIFSLRDMIRIEMERSDSQNFAML